MLIQLKMKTKQGRVKQRIATLRRELFSMNAKTPSGQDAFGVVLMILFINGVYEGNPK